MLVEEELSRYASVADTVLTIGVFDGVHLGHRHLLNELRRQAEERHMVPGVVTFRQHPDDMLRRITKLPFLTDIETRVKLLQQQGIDIVVTLSFTPELSSLDARSFIELLQKHLKMRGLVVGPDFALGKSREGSISMLEKLGESMGFTVTTVSPLVINGETVSSTAIRKAMADGDMQKVYDLTGHHFSLHGQVVTGKGRGEELGFPTANLNIQTGQALPPDGVYAGLAHINGNVFRTVTNIGRNPTFGKNDRTVEAFLIDYHGDLYGRDLSVDFVAKLRDEKKFGNAEALQHQVVEDIEHGKALLDAINGNK